MSLSDQLVVLATVAAHCGKMAADKSGGKVHPVVAIGAARNRIVAEMNKLTEQETKR